MSAKHEHQFQRLSDEAIFCACGEIKFATVPVCTQPHYYWWPQPYTPYVYPTFTWTSGGTTTTSGDITIGTSGYVFSDTSSTGVS